ncbi:hypothetical protein ACIRPX_19025 [Streptomyces sp. NPDC101225]|uniref:hypothetical protein n=1 Tax=Streptomyces sp. NPDC101225 TaxID=3366135 RepID=UPI00381B1D79
MRTLAPRATPLRADCVADSAGGLTFDVPAAGEVAGAHVVLHRRDGHEEVCLPLTPAGDGRLRAALPSSVALSEGRWEAFARVDAGEPRRLQLGTTDLRSLAARNPSGSRGHVAVRIPYATRQGRLVVRSWLRAPHAEAGEPLVARGVLTVSGRMYGTGVGPHAYAEVHGRHASVPVRRAAVLADRAAFRFQVAYAALEPGVWDLWLRPAGEAGPAVRVARLLDDVADKKPVFTYPRVRVDTPYGPVEAGPYYTRDNDLSVSVTACASAR